MTSKFIVRVGGAGGGGIGSGGGGGETSDMIQCSPEWFAIRCGKVTASKISDLMAKTKTGWGASRANYMAQLIAERLTGCVAESYTNAAMEWGTNTEADGRRAYSFYSDNDVIETAFVPHPTISMAGCSPDGMIGTEGMVEIKCPNTATHIDTLLGRSVPGKYILQMQFQMACTGAQWSDFVSFDPRLPEEMRLFVKRVDRDPTCIAEIEGAVAVFLAELDAKLAELTRLYRQPLAAE